MVVRVRSATVTAAIGRLIEGGGERHRGAKHSTIHKKNVRRAVTRRAYRVLGQDRATIGGQICLRNPAVGAGAAIRGEGAKVREEYLAAVLEIHENRPTKASSRNSILSMLSGRRARPTS